MQLDQKSCGKLTKWKGPFGHRENTHERRSEMVRLVSDGIKNLEATSSKGLVRLAIGKACTSLAI